MEKRHKRIKSEQSFWINGLIGGGIGFSAALITALLMPLVLLRLADPNSYVLIGAAICLFIGGFAGGIISAVNSKGREIVSGSINSGVILAALLLISFMFKKGFSPLGFLILAAVVIISSLLGAFAVMKTNSSQKRNMNKMMKRR